MPPSYESCQNNDQDHILQGLTIVLPQSLRRRRQMEGEETIFSRQCPTAPSRRTSRRPLLRCLLISKGHDTWIIERYQGESLCKKHLIQTLLFAGGGRSRRARQPRDPDGRHKEVRESWQSVHLQAKLNQVGGGELGGLLRLCRPRDRGRGRRRQGGEEDHRRLRL